MDNVVYLDVTEISPNPQQPRKRFSQQAMKDLAQSIKECGVLQPISVRKKRNGGYELIAGERRLRASIMAGKATIPALVNEFSNIESAVAALTENLQREDLNFMEEAEAYYRLQESYRLTQAELAEKVGRSQSYICNRLRLLQLPDDVKQIIVEFGLSERHARVFLRIKDETLMKRIVTKVVEKRLSVKETEDLVTDTIERLQLPEGKDLPQGTDLRYSRTKKEREKRRLKNIKIFINTIRETIKLLKMSGVDVRAAQFDRGGYMEFVVKIPKQAGPQDLP